MFIADQIKYVGVNDHEIDLFEGQYPVPNGMAYNSYVIEDDKIAVMDSVDARFAGEWLNNVAQVLDGRKPDYLVIQHMEPDHSGSILHFVQAYPDVTVVASAKALTMMKNYTITSKSWIVCASRESRHCGKYSFTLYTGTIMENRTFT